MYRGKTLLVSSVALLSTIASADRLFTIRNSCPYTVWPAVTNFDGSSFVQMDKEQWVPYQGTRGWEAKPGTEKTITIPEKWNGKIAPRRSCSGTGDDFKCAAGVVAGALEPEFYASVVANMAEFNLLGWSGNEFYDISNVMGFVAPMSLVPSVDSCQAIVCQKDLNPTCPPELALRSDQGETVGCLSACLKGINAQEPSVNCCSGKYNSKDTCLPDQVDFYGFFKNGCANAYAYPYDFQEGSPVVDWSCPTDKKADYLIEFCPGSGGGGTAEQADTRTQAEVVEATKVEEAQNSSRTRVQGSTSLLADAQKSSAAGGASAQADKTTLESPTASSRNEASALTDDSRRRTEPSESSTKATQAGHTAAAAETAAASQTSDDVSSAGADEGLSKQTVLIAVGAAVVIMLIIVVAVAISRRGKGARHSSQMQHLARHRRTAYEGSDASSDEDEEAHGLIGRRQRSLRRPV